MGRRHVDVGRRVDDRLFVGQGHVEQPIIDAATPPATGSLFGAFVGVQGRTSEAGGSEKDMLDSEILLGRTWQIDHRFYSTEDWNARTQWSIDHHKIPLITWEPGAMKLDDIVAGKHDADITARAESLKSKGAPIYLRWGHEMNGDWYAWSGAKNGGAAGGPAKYVAAYKHTHDLFVAAGATNVIWIWCPLVNDVPAVEWNHWTHYYPGDDYVDWVGMDGYNWGSSSPCCVWQSFDTLFAKLYADYQRKKPLMIPEIGSAEVGGSKAAWVRDMHQQLKGNYSLVRAVVWFHINKETDWRINSSPSTLEAFKEMANDPWFNQE
ncbi:MAG: hypothetical protein EOP08_08415 [Proteobacteria bacterium]|nr:MAG: hypothetical protein EOP08_08415 [Pseudomonadota bacterium]